MNVAACAFENLGNSGSPDAGCTTDGGMHSTTAAKSDASKASDGGKEQLGFSQTTRGELPGLPPVHSYIAISNSCYQCQWTPRPRRSNPGQHELDDAGEHQIAPSSID